MDFNAYMYEIIGDEIKKGLAEGRKIRCKAFIRKRIIQTLIFGIIFAIVMIFALSERGNEPLLFLDLTILVLYFLVLYLTPFMATVLKLCKKRPDDRIADVISEEIFKCTH